MGKYDTDKDFLFYTEADFSPELVQHNFELPPCTVLFQLKNEQYGHLCGVLTQL